MTTSTTTLEPATTADLRRGDIVHLHGMRLYLDTDPRTFTGTGGRAVHYVDAEITNFDHLVALAETDPLTAGLIVSTCRDGRYPLQGHGGRRWQREPRA
ncbi:MULTISPECIES: hypothetical protein [unclassified Nocardia]|uniref:hypothetical protein n=1 Tax=unclassified Nocardia TaxID=2637762 RepID=UPI00278C402A|nr:MULTISPECIES: hypothetical protein [unclassified Nocardia]